MSKRNSRGFTLIEFMIVLCIIGILAAIAVPNFVTQQNRAKDAQTKANMQNLETAVKDFRKQNDDVMPTTTSQLMSMLPDKWYDPQTKRMRNAVTRKFTEPSEASAPGAIIYDTDGKFYYITGYDHNGVPLQPILTNNK